MKQIFIDILAFTTLFSGLLVITSKNPVISVIYLIATFFQAAGFGNELIYIAMYLFCIY